MDLTRYYTFGDLWLQIMLQYGADAADRVAAAADTGDMEAVRGVIYDLSRGATTPSAPLGNTSTLGNFVKQITTDPLGAPLDAANKGLGQALLDLLKNPLVLLAGALILFFAFGGGNLIRRKLQ